MFLPRNRMGLNQLSLLRIALHMPQMVTLNEERLAKLSPKLPNSEIAQG